MRTTEVCRAGRGSQVIRVIRRTKMLRNFGSIRAQSVLALPTSIPIEIKVELITSKEKKIFFSKSVVF